MVRRRISICLCLLLLFIPSCANPFQEALTEQPANESKVTDSLGLDPDLAYKLPRSVPNILINQIGYRPDSIKTAIFRGENLDSRFQVIEAETGKVMLSGELAAENYSEDQQEYQRTGDFSHLQKEGTYYIYNSTVGYSYTFRIEKNIYADLFDATFQKIASRRCRHHTTVTIPLSENVTKKDEGGWHTDDTQTKKISEGSYTVANLLMAYELYPEAFSDVRSETETTAVTDSTKESIPKVLELVKEEIVWMQQMQDLKTGGVYASVNCESGQMDDITLSSTAEFAAVMAKFSHSFKQYDKVLASQCLTAAEKAWQYIEHDTSNLNTDIGYFAAAELFRETGRYKYSKAVETYLSMTEEEQSESEYQFSVYGDVSYISTGFHTNMDFCSVIMERLMRQAEEIATESAGLNYYAEDKGYQSDQKKILKEMVILGVVDYIITNNEYETVMENYLNYFLGRNPDAVSMVTGFGQESYTELTGEKGILEDSSNCAAFFFMLSDISGS